VTLCFSVWLPFKAEYEFECEDEYDWGTRGVEGGAIRVPWLCVYQPEAIEIASPSPIVLVLALELVLDF
jgi:hypothetical protein